MKIPYLSSLKRYGKEYANSIKLFRSLALIIDDKPDLILNYCEDETIQSIIIDRNSNSFERTCTLEALSYGDPGVVLASPGPSLSGLILRELGTPNQIDDFYNFLLKNNARTFFALTEPQKGSDAGGLQSSLTPTSQMKNQFYLNGEKYLFGNGAVAKIGVVLARTAPGPLGIRAVLITPDNLNDSKQIQRENLPMTALRGAQIAYMNFSNCQINKENILGSHKKPMEQGMMAIVKTFNRLRTGVGALAIGQAQAVLDYVYQNKNGWCHREKTLYTNLYYKLESVRSILRESAKIVDQNPFHGSSISIAKLQATHIAEEVISTSITILGPTILLENQWIAKCYRDCFAWEYMEGTRNMQLKTIYQSLNSKILNNNIQNN